MTDNEIIKVLNRCFDENHCGDCPLEYLTNECV